MESVSISSTFCYSTAVQQDKLRCSEDKSHARSKTTNNSFVLNSKYTTLNPRVNLELTELFRNSVNRCP